MSLKDRLAAAMAGPPKVSQAALARACKVSQPSVNDWLSGKTKTIRGGTLLAVARYLHVDPDWLATGKATREMNVKLKGEDLRAGSQNPTIDARILSRALFWLDFEERAMGLSQPMQRAERLITLYQLIEQDGGELSPQHTDELIDAARHQGERNVGNAAALRGGRRA